MLDALKLNSDVKVETEKDTLGGGVLPTDVYAGKLACIYLDSTKTGAIMANIVFETNGRKVTESECIASNKTGTLKTTYTAKSGPNEGKEVPLPGYEKILRLVRLVSGDQSIADLSAVETRKVIIPIYDFEKRQEVKQEKTAITDTINVPMEVGIYKHVVDKNAKGDDGVYRPTGETREVNIMDRFFTEEGKTAQEVADDSPAEFKEQWLEAHKGKVKDKSTKKAGGAKAGAPAGAAGGGTPALDL